MSNSIISEFLPQLKQFVSSETVFGEEYKLGEVTVVPVNSVKVAFMYGNNEKQPKMNSGAGGAVTLKPVAFLIVKGDQVTLQPLAAGGSVESLLEKIPDFLEKGYNLFDKIAARSKKNAGKENESKEDASRGAGSEKNDADRNG